MSGGHGRKHDAKGRSKYDSPHIRLHHWMMETEAWLSLGPAERVAYLQIEKRFNGINNGQIGLSSRTAAKECRISKATAIKAFARLVEVGFVACVTPGGFATNSCRAPEWRLTRAPCDVTGARASLAFKAWKKPEHEVLAEREKAARRSAALASNVAKRSPKLRTVPSENKDSRLAKSA